MSEQVTGEATGQEAPVESGQPSQSQQTQPSQTQSQEAQTQQSQPDNNAVERLRSQVNGMKSMVDPLIKSGFNTPDSIQNALSAHGKLQQLQSRGIDIDALLGTEQQQAQQKPESPSTISLDDIEGLLNTREAKQAHSQSNDQANSTLRSFASEIGGEQSDIVWQLTQQAARGHLQSNGRLYPAGHPLHETDYMPLNEGDIETIKATVKKQLDAIGGMRARASVQETQTPGGGNSMDGAATSQDQTRGMADKASRRARIEELMRQNEARLGGETISNA